VKDKYGDVDVNEGSEEESESETEDEDAQELTKDVELEFFRALALLKSKDRRIYDKEKTRFFEGMARKEESGEEGGPSKERRGNGVQHTKKVNSTQKILKIKSLVQHTK